CGVPAHRLLRRVDDADLYLPRHPAADLRPAAEPLDAGRIPDPGPRRRPCRRGPARADAPGRGRGLDQRRLARREHGRPVGRGGLTMRAWISILTIAWRETWTTYRHPVTLLWLVVLPLVFGAGVSRLFTFGGEVPVVAVVDYDETAASAALIRGLEETPYEIESLTREEALDLVASGRLSSALIIPAGFEASVAAGHPRLEIIQGPAMGQGSPAGRARAVAQAL